MRREVEASWKNALSGLTAEYTAPRLETGCITVEKTG